VQGEAEGWNEVGAAKYQGAVTSVAAVQFFLASRPHPNLLARNELRQSRRGVILSTAQLVTGERKPPVADFSLARLVRSRLISGEREPHFADFSLAQKIPRRAVARLSAAAGGFLRALLLSAERLGLPI
jgi:hypothetical protein